MTVGQTFGQVAPVSAGLARVPLRTGPESPCSLRPAKAAEPGEGDLTRARVSAQVDMFSYGMVLYELLSGQRPALGHHQLQIAKKLSKGIRPVLGQPEEVQFHRLQALMMECWDTRPEKVPREAEGPARACAAARPQGWRVANARLF